MACAALVLARVTWTGSRHRTDSHARNLLTTRVHDCWWDETCKPNLSPLAPAGQPRPAGFYLRPSPLLGKRLSYLGLLLCLRSLLVICSQVHSAAASLLSTRIVGSHIGGPLCDRCSTHVLPDFLSNNTVASLPPHTSHFGSSGSVGSVVIVPTIFQSSVR